MSLKKISKDGKNEQIRFKDGTDSGPLPNSLEDEVCIQDAGKWL